MKSLIYTFQFCTLLAISLSVQGQQRVFYPSSPDCNFPNLIYIEEGTVAYSYNPNFPNTDFPTSTLCFGAGVAHNLGWYRFITKENGPISFSLNFNTASCEQGQGIQGGILSDCEGTEVLDCNAACNVSTFSLSYLATAGEDYYLWIDGCNGDICEYEFTISSNELCKDSIHPLLLSYYHDANLDCSKDTQEAPAFYCSTQFEQAGQGTVTSINIRDQGFVQLSSGDYHVTSSNRFLDYEFCPDGFTLTVDSTSSSSLAIGNQSDITCGLIQYNIIPPTGINRFRCNNTVQKTLNIEAINTGNVESNGDSVMIFTSPYMTDVEFNFPWTTINDSTYRLDLDKIMPGQISNIEMKYYLKCDAGDIGKILCVKAESTKLACPENHTLTYDEYCNPIVLAYDPNDITVLPYGITDQHYIEKDQKLDYLIRLENTGNDTAYNVRIQLETGEFDPQSVLMGFSSHQCVAKYQTTPDNKITFFLNNINLVDSMTNPDAAQGYIKFSLLLNDPDELERIQHSAKIYFDFNPPIATNTQRHTIAPAFIRDYQTIDLCEGDEYNGQIYLMDTLWHDTIVTNGPDRINTYNIQVHEHYLFEIDTIVQQGDSILGVPIDTDTFVQRNYFTQYDCDSIYIYNVSVDGISSTVEPFENNILIYPNPVVDNTFNVSISTTPFRGRLTIVDQFGKTTYIQDLQSGKNDIRLPEKMKGTILFYRIQDMESDNHHSGKLLLQ